MFRGIYLYGDGDTAFTHVQNIRRKVFIEEQGIGENTEFDGMDDAAVHVLIYDDNEKPVATARMTGLGEHKFSIGKLAVLKEARGQKYAEVVMRMLMDKASLCSGERIYIEVQSYFIPYYKKLGFKVCGDIFKKADIKYVTMDYDLTVPFVCHGCEEGI